MPNYNIDRLPGGKVKQIVREAASTERQLREMGEIRMANTVARLIRSRISAHAENSRNNQEIRKLFRLANGEDQQ